MRRKPYTAIGIRRKACCRCGKPASTQWQICADGRVYRPMCAECDVALNELVMRWVWNDMREEALQRYRAKVLA